MTHPPVTLEVNPSESPMLVFRKIVASLALIPLLAACSQPGGLPQRAPGPDGAQAALTEPAASPTPTPTPPTPLPDDPCIDSTIWPGEKSDCSAHAQEVLTELGFFDGKVQRWYAPTAVNATLNFQRSRGLVSNGVVNQETWVAMLTNAPATPEEIPVECKVDGHVLCASQAHRTMWYLIDGNVERTTAVRYGGYTTTKEGKWRNHPTANGEYEVYTKSLDPCSPRYGCGVMPYSLIFHPDMYVHYSADFEKKGYAGSSHGCINVGSKEEAQWLFENVPLETKVIVYGPQPWAEPDPTPTPTPAPEASEAATVTA